MTENRRQILRASLVRKLLQQSSTLLPQAQVMFDAWPKDREGAIAQAAAISPEFIQQCFESLGSLSSRGFQGAFRNLEAGVYGLCQSCRGEITESRLDTLPLAKRCCPCQEKYDAGSSDFPQTTAWAVSEAAQRGA